ncbi:MAG: hypothetical protein ACI8UP_005247 [Porticoccaceae bacterium]
MHQLKPNNPLALQRYALCHIQYSYTDSLWTSYDRISQHYLQHVKEELIS